MYRCSWPSCPKSAVSYPVPEERQEAIGAGSGMMTCSSCGEICPSYIPELDPGAERLVEAAATLNLGYSEAETLMAENRALFCHHMPTRVYLQQLDRWVCYRCVSTYIEGLLPQVQSFTLIDGPMVVV